MANALREADGTVESIVNRIVQLFVLATETQDLLHRRRSMMPGSAVTLVKR